MYLSCVDPPQDCLQWLETYQSEDLIVAELGGNSNSLWTISPPSRKSLIEMLETTEDFSITVSWSIQRCKILNISPSCIHTSVVISFRPNEMIGMATGL